MPHTVVKARNQYFIGTDSGIFSLILDEEPVQVIHLDIHQESDYFTFPVRDLFCKAAAEIVAGKELSSLGVEAEGVKQLQSFQPVTTENSINAKVIHIDQVQSLHFKNRMDLCKAAALFFSVPYDFLTKIAGRSDFMERDAASFPWADAGSLELERVLRLTCVTSHYVDLWEDLYPQVFVEGRTHAKEPNDLSARSLSAKWSQACAYRSDLERRNALVELDVLAAQILGLSLEELIGIYRIYFGLIELNEAGTWFDQNGRIVWTSSKGLPGVGWLDDRGKSPGRAAWEKILADDPAELTCTAIDDTMPGGPRTVTRHFVGPFTQCDRIEDYRRAWAHFERLKAVEAAE
jgi:hypothetical protein